MKTMIAFFSILLATPLWAQSPSDYLDRGRSQLAHLLQDHGDWDVKETAGQLVASCRSCPKETVIRFSIDDLSERVSGVSGRLAYVENQRNAYCQSLVSNRQGRCIDWAGGEATSVVYDADGDVFVAETNLLYGPDLVQGQFRGPEDTKGLRSIRNGLRFVARSLTPLW